TASEDKVFIKNCGYYSLIYNVNGRLQGSTTGTIQLSVYVNNGNGEIKVPGTTYQVTSAENGAQLIGFSKFFIPNNCILMVKNTSTDTLVLGSGSSDTCIDVTNASLDIVKLS